MRSPNFMLWTIIIRSGWPQTMRYYSQDGHTVNYFPKGVHCVHKDDCVHAVWDAVVIPVASPLPHTPLHTHTGTCPILPPMSEPSSRTSINVVRGFNVLGLI